MSKVIAKKGATTTLTCTKRNSDTGAAESVSAIDITAILRDDKFNDLVSFTITKQVSTGVFTIQINPADIAGLSPTTFFLYIKYDYGTASDILDPVMVNIVETGD
jgi:hypothetical protein